MPSSSGVPGAGSPEPTVSVDEPQPEAATTKSKANDSHKIIATLAVLIRLSNA
jgi:hypothetical protein